MPTIFVVLGTVVLSQVVLNLIVKRLHQWQGRVTDATRIDRTMMQLLVTIIKIVIWTLAALVICQFPHILNV